MNGADAAALEREARLFAVALLGAPPTPYAVACYGRGVAALVLAPEPGFDRVLLAVARRGVFAARVADAYAGLFARHSTLRRRLTLLLAVLELAPPADAAFAPRAGSPLTTVAAVVAATAGTVALACLGAPLLAPLQLAGRLAGRR